MLSFLLLAISSNSHLSLPHLALHLGYTRRIIAYDTKGNKFVKCADMKDRRMHHGATIIKSKLYVTGGRSLTTDNVIEDLDSLDCYDPETDTWTPKGKLPHKLFDHGCLTLHCVPSSNLL